MTCSPSLNHCIAAPAINTLPSSAKTGFSSIPHAKVVSNPEFERTRLSPVLSIKKQPVPYVFFAIGGCVQSCPNKAAC